MMFLLPLTFVAAVIVASVAGESDSVLALGAPRTAQEDLSNTPRKAAHNAWSEYPGSNWTAHRLFDAAKPPTNARCLDGSPPLYYHSPGFGDGVDKWEIHMEGGAWCGDAQGCTGWWG